MISLNEVKRAQVDIAPYDVLVSDKEAFEAGVFLLERAKLNTELAASCTLASARRVQASFGKEDHVVLLICGGNNSLENWIHYREVLS